MLDITAGLRELTNVQEIHVVSFKNEVKELLWVMQAEAPSDPIIYAVHLGQEAMPVVSYKLGETIHLVFSAPKAYLYEPSAAMLKGGMFDLDYDSMGAYKLQQHSHLYTSEELLSFPGRRFVIKEVRDYGKSAMKTLGIQKANITTRNFPESVAALRKKWRIGDGGDVYLFFTTLKAGNRAVLVCEKI